MVSEFNYRTAESEVIDRFSPECAARTDFRFLNDEKREVVPTTVPDGPINRILNYRDSHLNNLDFFANDVNS